MVAGNEDGLQVTKMIARWLQVTNIVAGNEDDCKMVGR